MLISKWVLLLILLLATFNVNALKIQLTWTPPTAREDNTVLAEGAIAGYRIYHGTKQGDYVNQTFVPGGSTKNHLLDLPFAENYYIVMTAIDTDGRESRYSAEVSERFSKPNKPTFTMGVWGRNDYRIIVADVKF